LGVLSIIAGVGFAVFRVKLRGHASRRSPDKPERSEMTRLRLQ
jgi:hypothetical protein